MDEKAETVSKIDRWIGSRSFLLNLDALDVSRRGLSERLGPSSAGNQISEMEWMIFSWCVYDLLFLLCDRDEIIMDESVNILPCLRKTGGRIANRDTSTWEARTQGTNQGG